MSHFDFPPFTCSWDCLTVCHIDLKVMAMALRKQRFRYKPPRSSPNCDATTFPMYHLFRKLVPSNDIIDESTMDERAKLCFVRVEECAFRVPKTFFLKIPPESPESIQFSSGQGSTPEKPIYLEGHSSHQFRQILSAFTSYPLLDPRALTLDHILTIGELARRYYLIDLGRWFLPVFHDLIMSHDTPLRKSSNFIYVRTMKLAMSYGRKDLLISITTKWVSRMHWRELDPLSAILLADVYGMHDLLGHACYVYLMSAERRIQDSQEIDPKGLLSPRQKTYIMSGYHSLRAYWSYLRRNPPELVRTPQCMDHSKCVRVWKLRWLAAMDKQCPLPEADVLGRLIFIEQCLREDLLLGVCLTSACKVCALKTVSAKRDLVARQLHHHFDL